jgi:predicted nucleotidyltransferase
MDAVIQRFLEKIGPVRQKIEAAYLFGSRARGTERPDSDYDLLLVVGQDFSLSEKDALYEQVMDILLETGRLVSLKIFKRGEFQRLRDLNTPFLSRVLKEGVKVG